MRTILREPLLHFAVLGALLFAVYGLVDRDAPTADDRILVTRGQIESLRLSYSRVWQRPPTPAELDGLIREHVREEVLAREAAALGLDLDDVVIRRRLRQKMEFIASDLAVLGDPTDAELGEFLAAHPDRFRIESRTTLRLVYLDPERRGDALARDAERLLAELDRPDAAADFRTLGDPTLLDSELVDVPSSEVVARFGAAFAREVEALPVGRWQGPVRSGYGEHLVLVEGRTPGRAPALAEVRDRVASAWADARRREENERFYHELLKHYTVTIEREAGAPDDAPVASM